MIRSKNRSAKMIWLAGLLAALMLLAACGNDSQAGNETDPAPGADEQVAQEENAGASETGSEAKTERTLTDAMGNEVTIPAEPKRVIASYLEDSLVALGITPVAQWSVMDGTSIQQYLQDVLQGIPTIAHDLPFEAVASFQPDLLIMDSAAMVEGGKYSQYARIAPTYVIGTELNNDWREELLTIGEIFGEKEKAEQVLRDYDQKAAEAKESVKDAIGSETAAAIWLVNNSFFVVNENLSSGAVLYGDLGITVPNVVKEVSQSGDNNWLSISLEKLAELDADHLFLINSDKSSGSQMLQDPLWANIPAVKNGHVYEYEVGSAWMYTGAVANSQIIDDVLESLVK